jgi:hypothetical protein
MLVCAGCGNPHELETGLSVDASTDWRGERLVIAAGVNFVPTEPMIDALENGVDLQIDVITRLSRRVGPVAVTTDRRRHPVRIRFLPLTEQWELERADGKQTFPRRWLLLEALERPQAFETGLTRERTDRGRWQIQIRAEFNNAELPPPMHLPSLFSPEWRMKSPWATWRTEAS